MASKDLLVLGLLLAAAFLVNCAEQPQPNSDPTDPGNEDPNPAPGTGGRSGGGGSYHGTGGRSGGDGSYPGTGGRSGGDGSSYPGTGGWSGRDGSNGGRPDTGRGSPAGYGCGYPPPEQNDEPQPQPQPQPQPHPPSPCSPPPSGCRYGCCECGYYTCHRCCNHYEVSH